MLGVGGALSMKGITIAATPERQQRPVAPSSASHSLAPLRAEVDRLIGLGLVLPTARRGKPRKEPPAPLRAGMKHCWSCSSDLPLAAFATDRKTHDAKRAACRVCDSRAASARAAQRRARLKAQVIAGTCGRV